VKRLRIGKMTRSKIYSGA